MKAVLFALVMTIVSTLAANATMRIADDVGGLIGTYIDKFSDVRQSGERVVIDGACLSACTLVLGIVPRNRICVTKRAMLGFHASWMPGSDGKPVPSAVGTQVLWDLYPQNIRRWITARGGLNGKMIFLRGGELLAMYPECRSDGWIR